MKKRFGDRKDGRKVRDLDGMHNIMLGLMPKRCDSDVYMNVKIDVTALVKYVEKYKKEHPDNKITFFHAFTTALGKVIYNKPLMNRFVCNSTFYDRNEVMFAFVMKVSFDDKAEEMMIQCKINPDDNIDKISERLAKKVNKVREDANHVEKKGANSAMDILAKLPNIIRVPLVGFFKWLDKIGYLPDFLANDNIYYSSFILSNLGSFKFGSIHHNINEFGISSGLGTIGEIKDEEVIIDGKKQVRKMVEFGANYDERASDGFYLIKSLKMLQYIFDHPKMLEDAANEKIEC